MKMHVTVTQMSYHHRQAHRQTDKFINHFTFQTFKLRTMISENILKMVIVTPVSIWSHLTNHRGSLSKRKETLLSLHWMAINQPIPDVHNHIVLEALQHTVWPCRRDALNEDVPMRGPMAEVSSCLEEKSVWCWKGSYIPELIRKPCHYCNLRMASIFPVKLLLSQRNYYNNTELFLF